MYVYMFLVFPSQIFGSEVKDRGRNGLLNNSHRHVNFYYHVQSRKEEGSGEKLTYLNVILVRRQIPVNSIKINK